MFGKILENVRKSAPLVHNITNYVTVNDCANILLACGASPIMADDIGEAAQITSICSALNINIGTLNSRTIPAMFAAGKAANGLKHPAVLDPVGAGASELRTDTAKNLIKEVKFAVIRGNISEIKALALGVSNTSGVDAGASDEITNIDGAVDFAVKFSKRTGAIIAITGATDIVTDGKRTYLIKNGHPMMSKVTGTGCMLSALVAAFTAVDGFVDGVAAAVAAMGLCGENAVARLGKRDGNSSLRNYIIDEMYNLTEKELDEGAKYEVR
ncbi:MAG: hydroxyethylthiazole kinase [Clostridiaceae bacterium]|jgi:hydroxyethylthiazole kinase|nr:hydroxyethylthiazole kinase [Clostridiaceae bacterium]